MKCFEVVGNNIFICFANGKMCVYDKTTQEQVRKPVAAHAAEIKDILHGPDDLTVITCCLDNQVRTWHASPEVVAAEGTPLGPIAQRSDAKKQVNTLLVTGSGSAFKVRKRWL